MLTSNGVVVALHIKTVVGEARHKLEAKCFREECGEEVVVNKVAVTKALPNTVEAGAKTKQ